jgi:hypothetical protein
MAVVFKVAPKFQFSNVEGPQSDTQQVSFGTNVKDAQVALQGFTFDFEGVVERPIDKVHVSISKVTHAGNDVTVSASVNYTGKARNDYNATVTVLVIAEV